MTFTNWKGVYVFDSSSNSSEVENTTKKCAQVFSNSIPTYKTLWQ